jgi:CheY-like chemotaxis protein
MSEGAAEPAGLPPSVLIADDDANSAAFLIAVVRNLGFEPVWVTDGQSAFDRAKAVQPVLILMDLVMPGLDGVTSIRLLSLSASTRGIPVIVVSGIDADDQAAKCQEAGAARTPNHQRGRPALRRVRPSRFAQNRH